MRISKRRLRMIIKEEYTKLKRQGLLNESVFSRRSSSRLTTAQLRRLIREALDEEDDSEEEKTKASDGFDRDEREASGEYDKSKKKPKKPKAQDMR